MTVIEISEDRVRRAAGDEKFGQALELADKVTGLRLDGLVVTAAVDGLPVSVRFLPDAMTGTCGCPVEGLCAHAVAAALAWVRTGKDPDAPDLFEVLRVQDPDWLAARLTELADADPALADRLLAQAESAPDDFAHETGERAETTELRAELHHELDVLEDEAAIQGEHNEWYPDTDVLDELLDDALDLVPDDPHGVRILADFVIVRIERLLDYGTCHGEEMPDALDKAQDLHLAACEASPPDPEALAERLIRGAVNSGWATFEDGPARYARVLGAAGLARYRSALDEVPASTSQYVRDGLRASLARAEKTLG